MMFRTRAFTLLEVTLAVLVGIVLLATSAAAFNMYRQQALIQQAKTELQQVRSQLAMAAYRQGYPCSTAVETVNDPVIGGQVGFQGWQFYAGAVAGASGVTDPSAGTTQIGTMANTLNFWTGEVVSYWYQPSGTGAYVEGGTAVFPGPSNKSTSVSSVNLTSSTISTSAPGFNGSGYLATGLMSNMAGRDPSNNPISFLSTSLPNLGNVQLPNGAGITDPFTGIYNVRIIGQTYSPPLPPRVTGTNFDFQYVNSPDNSADFGGLAMDVNCNVEWVLPSTWSTGVTPPGGLDFAGDPPVNW